MEFNFDLNKVLPSTITFVDCQRSSFRNNAADWKLLRKQLDEVIDTLGSASSKAQGLQSVITSAMKFQHSDHEMYILKDATANRGQGAAVGMIKVGRKKLFLLDMHGTQNEVIPLCVMDFYVHHSRQRNGCGKKLFEHMLKAHNLQPSQVAIDRPSHKFLSFLKKHYGLQNSLSQPNNFLVFDQFFKDLNAVGYVPRRSQRMRSVSGNPPNRPPVHPYRRNSANSEYQQASSQPPRRSSSRSTSRNDQLMEVDCDDGNEFTKTVLPPIARPPSRESLAGGVKSTDSLGSRECSANTKRGLLAQASLYSRHGSADMIRTSHRRPNETWSRKAVSAGTVKSLHASSQDNPLATNQTFFRQRQSSQEQSSRQLSNRTSKTFQQHPLKTETTKGGTNFLSSTGNYTLSSLLNSQKTSGLSPCATSWNVLGVPPAETNVNSSQHREKYGRRIP